VLCSTVNGQLQSQHEYKQQEKHKDNTNKKRTKINMSVVKFEQQFVRLSVDLQHVLSAETLLTAGQ
jgi:hypothetical protein